MGGRPRPPDPARSAPARSLTDGELRLLAEVEQLYEEGVLVLPYVDCGHDDWWFVGHRRVCRICHPPASPTLPSF